MRPSTIVAAFRESSDADRAVDVLRRKGFDSDTIGLVGHAGSTHPANTAVVSAGGGVSGGVVGAVAAGLIPGVGPLVAAGILATTLAGAAVGAAVGGLVGRSEERRVGKECG